MKNLTRATLLAALVAVCATTAPTSVSAEPPNKSATGSCPVLEGLPSVRRAGRLEITSPPKKRTPFRASRMRSHTEHRRVKQRRRLPMGDPNGPNMRELRNALRARSVKQWIGPEVPKFVPLREGEMFLDLLDDNGDGSYLALYRKPPGQCRPKGLTTNQKMLNWDNCETMVRIYSCAGKILSSTKLNPLFSRTDHLEVQDVHTEGGILYFNEGCQTYSKDAGGKCSSLVAMDIARKKVLWRTKPRTSNNVFLLHDDVIVAGYGFTAERNHLSLVNKNTGRVVHRALSRTATFGGGNHDSMMRLGKEHLRIGVYGTGRHFLYRIAYLGTPHPQLVQLSLSPPIVRKKRRRRPPPKRPRVKTQQSPPKRTPLRPVRP